jgi:hypothetical protein
MRKRRVVLAAAVLALAGLTVLVLTLVAPPPLEATLKNVREGMTLAEVEAVLGVPDNDDDFSLFVFDLSVVAMKRWKSGRRVIYVGFDADGKVVNKAYSKSVATAWEKFLDKMETLFGQSF